MHPLDKAALLTMGIPGLGDVLGLAADTRMLSQEPESRTPLNFGLSAMGLLPFVPSLGMVKAFHGTPHKVDKFRLDKIGTGEGAQAYGHGLYFAENPEVAGRYAPGVFSTNENFTQDLIGFAQMLPDGVKGDEAAKLLKNLDAAYPISDAEVGALMPLLENKNVQKQLSKLRKLKYGSKEYWEQESKVFDAMQDIGTSRVYNVKLNVEPEQLLDWDAPLSEQPESFKKLFEEIADTPFNNGSQT